MRHRPWKRANPHLFGQGRNLEYSEASAGTEAPTYVLIQNCVTTVGSRVKSRVANE